MAEFVVSFVVERLGDLLIEKATFLHGVKQNVEQIRVELRRMQCFLKDADKRQDEDDSIRNWVSEIREVAYDAEDVIATFTIKIATPISNPLKRYACFFDQASNLNQVGSEIEAINDRISDLTRSTQTYGLSVVRDHQGSSSIAFEMQRQLRWSYSHVIDDHIVGLQGNINELVAELMNEEKHGRVVSICGMGGLGKTTLAKEVYRNDRVRRYFEGSAWAYISQQCKPRDVWEGILIKLTSPSKEERDHILKLRDEELAKKLYQVQMEKKYLVVLDDIWSIEAWKILSPAFPSSGKGCSRILLTTRNKDLASFVDRSGLHEPRNLTEEESWELLQKKAFPRNGDPDFIRSKDKEQLGREMVKKCAGLPLAIVVLGGLLATKETVHEWDIVHRDILSYLKRAKGDEQHSTVPEVLALSYHDLPFQLKPCFLYLSHFPEDFEIPRRKLVQLWIAEGIVSPHHDAEGDETIEDVAERYLGYLINRCMVQVGTLGSTGKIKTCRLHDLMRDLCLSKAKRENFLQNVHYSDEGMMVDSSSSRMLSEATSTGKTRRLAVFLPSHVDNLIPSKYKEDSSLSLRSLVYFHASKCRLVSWQLTKTIFEFKMLKVLDLEGVKGPYEKLPKDIGDLVQLQFLSLKKTHIQALPSSIGNLIHLKTLNLQTISKLSWDPTVQIPNVIWKMEGLRHLYLPKWCGNAVDKLQLGNLINLQTLVNFPANKCDVEVLRKLTNLRKLVLNDPKHFKSLVKIFGPQSRTLSCLESLSLTSETLSFPDEVVDVRQLMLSCRRLQKLHVEGRIEKLPEYHQFPPNLAKLTLWGSKLEEDPMPTLERLPNLRILSGWQMFAGKKMVCSNQGFPKLKSLLLRGFSNLEDWTMEEGAMPGLCRLEISSCIKLKTIPDSLRFVKTLQELEMYGCLFKVNMGSEGEDFYKVQHVPSVVIRN
ncbi:putative disease resistance protein At1g50180 [Pyrus x bretschneideri]|uniref:putative disease resistance protein At1g50180 n=1 Tax=Pyrus x bretschneideri TaxID=225117 RepID=UPI00202FA706|nr:putative disease resistance protein At1g50180 [Pyrus x bretschneideri]XP_048424435.1 putative disease resistance protein At1g50180 [Pyrus x bretschneideri]XP_048424436.1 putative disease resistance protein At1g50180 [Pyrus x bretschneideri]XP_048424437.1 putative disease resistance protein At1g50180 [Pyrus x bretschneideri]XP_048424438.1 putative disease resistance protein At1g50180 [Pyrus x bretschneideri]XP_048424439.1 putative disease resistance protein At1g50180 [Pyrus x bretschneideri]